MYAFNISKRSDVTDVSFGRVDLTSDEDIHTYNTDTEHNQSVIGTPSPISFTNNRAIGNPSFTTQFLDVDYSLDFIMGSDTLNDDAPSPTDTTGNAQFGITHASGKKNGLVVAAQGSGVFNITASVTVNISSNILGTTDQLNGRESIGIYAKLVKIGTGDDVSDFSNIVTSQDYGSTSFSSPTFLLLVMVLLVVLALIQAQTLLLTLTMKPT